MWRLTAPRDLIDLLKVIAEAKGGSEAVRERKRELGGFGTR